MVCGKSDRKIHNPEATAPAHVIVLKPSDSRSAARLPRRGMNRPTCHAMPPAAAATTIDFPNSSHGKSESDTSFRRWSSMAATIVFAMIPMSDAIASPTTDIEWNKTRYTSMDARVTSVQATIGVNVSPAA